tara:strand:+ start:594 stop:1169 length:576 start_codon:yes stop_codon:yes gene_type:complete
MDPHLKYHNWLRGRNIKGIIYRKYFLYPKINKFFNSRILDVGCGVGDFLRYSENSIGIDINIFNINYVKDLGLEAYLMKDNKIPFSDKEFKSILLDNVLEHIENPYPLLKEIKRISSENAVFIVGVPGIEGFKRDSDHKIFYDDYSLKELIQKFGFNHIKTFYMPLNFKFLSKLISQFCVYQVFIRDLSKP